MHYYSSTVSTALRTHLTGNLQVFNNNSYITEVTRRGYKALNVCSIQPPNSDQRCTQQNEQTEFCLNIKSLLYQNIKKKKISIKKWLLDLTFFFRYISAWCHHHQRFYSVIVKELFLFKQILKVTSGSKSCACTRIFSQGVSVSQIKAKRIHKGSELRTCCSEIVIYRPVSLIICPFEYKIPPIFNTMFLSILNQIRCSRSG